MPLVRFLHEGRSTEVRIGLTILEAARLARVIIETPCNAIGSCGKCMVRVGGAEYLACNTPVTDDIDVVTIDIENESLKILSEGAGFTYDIDPFVEMPVDTPVDMPSGVSSGVSGGTRYGIALDIGTTTLVAALIDLKTGVALGTEPALNPQAAYGQDVLSRIHFTSGNGADTNNGGLNTLFTVFRDELNRMITKLCTAANISNNDIYEIVFSGNTTMLHLATNTDPYTLGQYPYTPKIYGGNFLNAADLGIGIAKKGIVYLPPIISAYIGADITSGILVSELDKRAGRTLFIDIGTNGEIVLANNGVLAASSTAAGPAFEGMNITCGMRASRGAIESFRMDDDKKFAYKTIGGAPAAGLCGSGLLDVVGELVSHDIINKTGRFSGNAREFVIAGEGAAGGGAAGESACVEGAAGEGACVEGAGAKNSATESSGKENSGAKRVFLSQKDIRQVQLAKSAVRTGIEFLLAHFNLTASDIDKVEIAGSFGYHLNKESLINIGLLPREFKEKICFTGNTSLSGAKAFLLNKNFMPKMEKLVKTVQTVELSRDKNFEKVFIENLSF